MGYTGDERGGEGGLRLQAYRMMPRWWLFAGLPTFSYPVHKRFGDILIKLKLEFINLT